VAEAPGWRRAAATFEGGTAELAAALGAGVALGGSRVAARRELERRGVGRGRGTRGWESGVGSWMSIDSGGSDQRQPGVGAHKGRWRRQPAAAVNRRREGQWSKMDLRERGKTERVEEKKRRSLVSKPT
jgi:hypothetical protein